MRSEPSIEASLRELHAPLIEPPAPTSAGEAEALAAWAQRYAAPAGADTGSGLLGLFDMLGRHRLAVALAAMLMAIVGACVLPTSYDIPLGTSVEIRVGGDERLAVRDIAHYVEGRAHAAEVEVLMRELVREQGSPEQVMMIRLWDHQLALGEIGPELRQQFPALADAEIIETPLEGEVDTIWARRLAHRAFRVSLREADVEQARAQLLLELQARGFEADQIEVEVRDHEDGHREVEVQIERHELRDDAAAADSGFGWLSAPPAVPTHGRTSEDDERSPSGP